MSVVEFRKYWPWLIQFTDSYSHASKHFRWKYSFHFPANYTKAIIFMRIRRRYIQQRVIWDYNFKQLHCKVIIQVNVLKHCHAFYNICTRKYAHVILTILSSTYRFWGVYNLYQAKTAKLNIGVWWWVRFGTSGMHLSPPPPPSDLGCCPF